MAYFIKSMFTSNIRQLGKSVYSYVHFEHKANDKMLKVMFTSNIRFTKSYVHFEHSRTNKENPI